MKPYNTRKPRRTRFNAFPHLIPKWGWHKRRSPFYSHRHSNKRYGDLFNPYTHNGGKFALYDRWWEDSMGNPNQMHPSSCVSFLIMFSVLLPSVTALFVTANATLLAMVIEVQVILLRGLLRCFLYLLGFCVFATTKCLSSIGKSAIANGMLCQSLLDSMNKLSHDRASRKVTKNNHKPQQNHQDQPFYIKISNTIYYKSIRLRYLHLPTNKNLKGKTGNHQ